jgi:hypothetical protein
VPRRNSPTSQPDFAVDVYQNEFLSAGGPEVSAVVTVASSGVGESDSAPAAPEAGSDPVAI